jgi:two-component system NarL family sensor kinase
MKICRYLILIMITTWAITNGVTARGASQLSVTDSLRHVISSMPDNTGKVDNQILLARNYFLSNQIDSSLYMGEKALNLATSLNYKLGMGDAYYIRSLAFRLKLDYKSSLSLAEKYIEIYLDLRDSLRLAKGYYQLGILHKELADYELALYYCQKSLDYSITLNESTLILGNYNCIGSVFFDGKSMYDSAAYYYLKALDKLEQSKDQAPLTTILNNLGNVYLADRQYETARNYYVKSLEINAKNNSELKQAWNLNNLGRVSSEEEKFQEALKYYDQALQLFIKNDDQRGILDVDNNFGDSYFKQKKFDQALDYFDRALAGYKKMGFVRGIVMSSLNKAAALSEMGKTTLAMAIQDSCLALADSAGGNNILILAYRNISDNYFKVGDYKQAYKYRLKHDDIYDNIYNVEKSKAINTLILKYEKGKDTARILELEKENLKKTNQRNAYMFSGLGIIILALFTVIYFRQRAVHDKALARQKIIQLEEEKKLMAAKLLVEGQEEERKRIATELHDGLGVLLSATKMQFSVISDKSPENKELIAKATRMLEQATGDVRKISHNMMPGLLTKLGFYEAVEDLFEHISDTKGLNAVCTITGDQERLSENKEIMLYRIVQEMVNNTLKHAEARNIELQIQVLAGRLDIKYTDDGKGFDFKSKLDTESIGLKSIQSRVSFLNGKLEIDSQPGKGVKYALKIPA